MWPGSPQTCERIQTNIRPNRRRGRNHVDKGYHGDTLSRKHKDCVRILLHNPGGIGFVTSQRCKQTLKMEKLKKLVIKNDIDLVGLTEVNKDWRKLDYEHTIWGATTNWRENRRIQTGQNITKPAGESSHLVGGVAMMAFGDLVFGISNQDSDFRKLGRWSTITITGKNMIKTTIFTCYCPCRGKSPGSTFSQHLVYMAEHKTELPDTACPRQLFGIDLKTAIEDKLDLGHQIIVMGDFNSEYTELSSWMLELGLVDVISDKHGAGPKTYNRSKESPIDCVFASTDLKMRKGGFLPFKKLLSDHRGVWLDIPKHMIYGYNPPQPTFPSARKLKLTDPRVVEKYLTHLHCAMEEHDLFHRMDQLHRESTYPLSPRLVEEYEVIDVLVCKLMDEAEDNCRILHTGTIPWSPAYKHACSTLEYWLKRRSYVNKDYRNVRYLIVLQNKLNLIYNATLSKQDIESEISKAYKVRKQCKLYAESLSLEYRTQLALAKEAAGELKAAVYLRNINHIEALRRIFRNIRHMEDKVKGGSTTKVTTTDNGIISEHTDREPIEKLFVDENVRKYHVTEGGSQLHNPEFISAFGNHGEGPATQQVLDGTYIPPPSASQDTRDFLSACQYGPKAKALSQPNDVVQRYRDHLKSWKIRNEKTCSYHQHIGHFKAVFNDKKLSWFFFQRADIPDMTGYSPTRHRECIDLMIMKKPSCYELKKQRTLGILDTEFNQNNKRIGRDGMLNASKLGKIAKEQFAVKHTSSIDQVVSKRCAIDHNQSKRRCFALASSDLEGCYDRIVHTAAAIALLRVGIPHTKIKSMFASIQRMIHRIRTAFGDSEITYGGDDIGEWMNYPQGVLQGNASGPTIWSVLSSIIFEILHKRGFAIEYCTSISKELFHMVGFAYVDDCDLIQSGSDPITVLQSMQNLINSWGSLMEVTGGAISVDKSWWYLIDYVWKRGKWIANDADTDIDLVANSAGGEVVSLKRLQADEASKMLGVWLTPNGDNTKLVKELRQSAIEWGSKVRSGNPSRKEAWQALHSNITAKLKYPLPACTLTEEECKSIMYPAIKAALPKAGITSNIAADIRDGPSLSGGSGLLSLFHYSGTSRTSMIVEQVARRTPTGMFLLTCIEDLVLDSGLYGSLWQMPFLSLKQYVQGHSLIFHACAYNHDHKIVIATRHGEMQPQRVGDQSLMSIAIRKFGTNKELKAIQRVRMEMGVVHLSDITSADGKKMDNNCFAIKHKIHIRNTYDWPIKHTVSKADYTTWRKFMKYVFRSIPNSLPTPLGSWRQMSTNDWTDNWDFFVTENRDFLYHKSRAKVWRRHLQRYNSHRAYFSQYLEVDQPTQDLLRVNVESSGDRITVISVSHRSLVLPPPPPQVLKFGAIRIRKPEISWFAKSISSSRHTNHLLLHILKGSAFAISDGSFFPISQTGSCAWIISTPDGSEWIQGGGLIPGEKQDQDPYRSELGGLLGLATIISGIILPPTIKPTITIGCDGLSALNQVGLDTTIIKARMKNVDMISIINSLLSTSKFAVNREHVYGHQDDLHRPLTQIETLNCRMDTAAKSIALARINGESPVPQFKPTQIGYGTITCNGLLIPSRVQTSLYAHITHNSMIKWLEAHSSLDTSKVNIHWPSLAKARKEASFSLTLFITKWLSGDTSTGRVMLQRKKRDCANCPRCNAPDEHLLHVLTCNSEDTILFRKNLVSEFVIWLRSVQTHPRLIHFFRLGIRKWFRNRDYTWRISSGIFTDNLVYNAAFKTQMTLGWYHLFCGFITQELVDMQQSHYTAIESRKLGSRWASQLIKKLWNITNQLWLHRNKALHNTDMIHELSGLPQLKLSITAEYISGLQHLPSVYSSYFYTPLPALLQKPVIYLKRWFLIIRSAREACTIPTTIDDFSVTGPLRTWIGLSAID